jgi:polyphosphate kinase
LNLPPESSVESLPQHFLNRELSFLAFNQRVLNQASDIELPLLERLKFLCISSTNLDEFFEIRVSGAKQLLEVGGAPAGPDGLTPAQLLDQVAAITRQLVTEQYRLLNGEIIPALEAEGILFIRREDWSREQTDWLEEYFREEVVPVLSPTTLDPTRPVPRILNKSLNFIVSLKGQDAFGGNVSRAIVQAPRSLPRLIQLPAELTGNEQRNSEFVFLSSIIHAFVDQLFRGIEITGCYQFRVTRNSDLYIDDEDVDDLVRALVGELVESRYGDAVRLETAHDCPEGLARYLLEHFQLRETDLYRVSGPVNLNRLMAIYNLVDRPDLKYRDFTPGVPAQLVNKNIFEAISEGDILLHHPFESFAPVVDFVYRAANDPRVVAIKQTLYRTTADSPIVESLVSAARSGKEVTALVELRARFDEAANIELASKLQQAGAHVVYGVVGFKTHCKMTMVVRRENNQLKRYVHLGTGNYHPGTARAYTDYGLLTANKRIGKDVHQVFMQLTSLMKTSRLKLLAQSPFNLHQQLIEKIRREIDNIRCGGNGHIIAKLNSLVEPEIIEVLYAASQAGVMIDLIVRGVCCLRPGVTGLSENITVRSIIGRFLEHTRCYYFHNNGDVEVFCASADWMDRNFFRRIEIMFPILDDVIKQRLIADLDTYLEDNTQSWTLDGEGEYRRIEKQPDSPASSAQTILLNQLAERT